MVKQIQASDRPLPTLPEPYLNNLPMFRLINDISDFIYTDKNHYYFIVKSILKEIRQPIIKFYFRFDNRG